MPSHHYCLRGCTERERPGNLLDVTFEPSWQRQGDGQGHNLSHGMAGVVVLNFVLRVMGSHCQAFNRDSSMTKEYCCLGRGEDE